MKKYVQVGCGGRGTTMYSTPLVKEFKDVAQLCGVYDINKKRAILAGELAGEPIPVFDSFEEMLEKTKPDTVIITPKDCDHDTYAIKAMKAGCDVIVEKPLTTTFEKSLEIKKVQEETGKNVTVTFNLRFHPFFKQLKEIIMSGVIGDVYSVNFEWQLDTFHGADYFRRWHRELKNSGSLMVHKSTHHFDIVNWLLMQDPLEVNAYGTLNYYGPVREERSERCLDCPHKDKCEFYMDINQPVIKTLYRDCEDVDGYYRDRCVFSDEIDIQDTVNLTVRYSGGTFMNYNLIANSPYEAMRIVLNGSKGRLEARKIMGHKPNYNPEKDDYIMLYDRKPSENYIAPAPDTGADHGGADGQLRRSLFIGHEPEPLGQMADLRAGMMSIGIGMAANISMKENRRVLLSEFYEELKKYE